MDYKNIQYAVEAMKPVVVDEATPPAIRDWAANITDILQRPLEPVERFEKGSELPTGIGALADEYADVRQRRLALDREASAVKERETEIYKYILGALSESTDTGASGHHHRVQLVTKERYNPEDWAKVHAFIQETGSFEMLQKRLADGAVKEYFETHGKLPDGIATVDVPTLSFTKV